MWGGEAACAWSGSDAACCCVRPLPCCCSASAPGPMVAVGASGDMPQPANDQQTPEQWLRMALASGWSPGEEGAPLPGLLLCLAQALTLPPPVCAQSYPRSGRWRRPLAPCSSSRTNPRFPLEKPTVRCCFHFLLRYGSLPPRTMPPWGWADRFRKYRATLLIKDLCQLQGWIQFCPASSI